MRIGSTGRLSLLPERPQRKRNFESCIKPDKKTSARSSGWWSAGYQKDQAGVRRLIEADLAKAPGRPFVRMMLGDAMAATAKPDLAAQQYELALQTAPGSPAIYRRLGQLCASAGSSRKLTPTQAEPVYSKFAVLNTDRVYDRLLARSLRGDRTLTASHEISVLAAKNVA